VTQKHLPTFGSCWWY